MTGFDIAVGLQRFDWNPHTVDATGYVEFEVIVREWYISTEGKFVEVDSA